MAYDKTKFYWLQLKEDFFDEEAIDWLEGQPNGKEYSLFYLKLCLKSLRTSGVLCRQVGNVLIPYDQQKLGEITNTNPDTVLVAMNLLLQIGLVEKLDDGKLYLTQIASMIGSQSRGAFERQQQRIARQQAMLLDGANNENRQMSEKCRTEYRIKNLEQELDTLSNAHTPARKGYGQFGNVMLSDEEYAELKETVPDAERRIEIFSCKLKSKGYRYEDHAATIILWYRQEQAEREKQGGVHSFDADEFFQAAVARTYGEGSAP